MDAMLIAISPEPVSQGITRHTNFKVNSLSFNPGMIISTFYIYTITIWFCKNLFDKLTEHKKK